MSVRITCINKDGGNHYDPHEAISHLGWIDEITKKAGKATRMQMVDFLEKGGSAYVKDFWGNLTYLVIRISRFGNKYVKTVADGRETNNLLELVECKA